MGTRIWHIARWPLALAAMGLVVLFSVPRLMTALSGAIEFQPEDSAASPGSTPTVADTPTVEPVTDGTADALADVAITGGTIAGPDDETIAIGATEDTLLLQFPLIEGDPSCIEQVLLEITLLDAVETELGVWPSAVNDFATLVPGGAAPAQVVIGDTATGVALTDGNPGRLRWDATTAYAQWVTGGQTPEGAPLVLAVRALSDSPSVVFASLESDLAPAPALVWTGADSCSVADPAAPTAAPAVPLPTPATTEATA